MPSDGDQTTVATQCIASLAWAGAREDRPNWAGLVSLNPEKKKQGFFYLNKTVTLWSFVEQMEKNKSHKNVIHYQGSFYDFTKLV